MINNVVLNGRLTKDVKCFQTANGKTGCFFTIACVRSFDKEHADFIPCVVWGQSAEYLSKYAKQGHMVSVNGRLQQRTYEDENHNKINRIEVLVNELQLMKQKEKEQENEMVQDQQLFEGIGSQDPYEPNMPF